MNEWRFSGACPILLYMYVFVCKGNRDETVTMIGREIKKLKNHNCISCFIFSGSAAYHYQKRESEQITGRENTIGLNYCSSCKNFVYFLYEALCLNDTYLLGFCVFYMYMYNHTCVFKLSLM